MIREQQLDNIALGFEVHPIIAILGPRQVGKTTLARQYCKKHETSKIHYFDLEHSTDIGLFNDPLLLLEKLEGLIVIDEIQRVPELFPLLRVLVDRENNKQQYLILGSASEELIKQSSETLAGRIQYIELTPFAFREVNDLEKLWLRGGYPKSFLAETNYKSFIWREHYIKTFLERDIPTLGIKVPSENIRRFWELIAHYHGNIVNHSELARSLGMSQPTIKYYLDILTQTFMIRQLRPWHENLSKRQVKSPKIYFRDSGILHSMLHLKDNEIITHPKLGASWEGFAMEEIIRAHEARNQECYFWSTHSHAEMDLLIVRGNKKIAYEFKYSSQPKITKSIHSAIESLKLDKVIIIYPGDKNAPLSHEVEIYGLEKYLNDI